MYLSHTIRERAAWKGGRLLQRVLWKCEICTEIFDCERGAALFVCWTYLLLRKKVSFTYHFSTCMCVCMCGQVRMGIRFTDVSGVKR